MSMEISGNYKDYQSDYLERVPAEREKVNGTGDGKKAEHKGEGIPVPRDEYISSEQSAGRASGLYGLGQDENGDPKVMYDDPEKAEKCTTDTDRVDREIEKLKEEKKQLEQQLRAVTGEEGKTREIERKLAQIESELSQKDNDAYRRQKALIS